MKKRIRRFFALVIAFCLCFTIMVSAESTYYYDNAGQAHEAPSAYEWSSSVRFGVNALHNIGKVADIFIDKAGKVYLLSSDTGEITVLDDSLRYEKTITPKTDGVKEDCSGASGIYISEYGDLSKVYLTDTKHNRILMLDMDGNVLKAYGRPETELIDEETQFLPLKVVVNESGYIITTCQGIYSGAVVMNTDGKFLGFYGSNKIKLTADVIYDYFWKKFFGASKSGTMSRYVPVEFSNLDINENGFVYTSTAVETDNSGLRLLNFNSVSLLPEDKKQGDLQNMTSQGKSKPTTFTDISYLGDGIVAVLDSARNRIFVYNNDGDLLTVLGGMGNYKGKFVTPVAIESYRDMIYAYDDATATLNIFKPNSYGENLISASRMYAKGSYTEAKQLWENILVQNNGFQTAYISIGRALMSMNDYKGAMEYFKLGESKSDYSEAFSQQRKIVLKQWFVPIFIIIIILICFMFYMVSDKRAARKRIGVTEQIGISYTLFHPSKGIMSLLNSEKIGYKFIFPVVMVLWFIINIFSKQYSGFIFNTLNTNPLDLRVEFIATIILGVTFVVTNWLIVTMTEGIGTLKQIANLLAVALIPYLCGKLFSTLISNVLLMEEAMIVTIPETICLLWSIAILLIGLSKIHEYKLSKAVLNLVFTIFGMVAVAFLLLLEISILKQIQQLLITVFDELVMLMQ